MSDAPLPVSLTFADLGLPESLLKALAEVRYESPSPPQACTLPPLLAWCRDQNLPPGTPEEIAGWAE